MSTFENIWELNKSGNIETVRNTYEYYCETNDPKNLYNAYKHYLKWWKLTFGSRAAKYISKTDRLKNLDEWLVSGGHKTEYSIPESQLMNYVGLNYCTPDELQASYERFKKKVSKKE